MFPEQNYNQALQQNYMASIYNPTLLVDLDFLQQMNNQIQMMMRREELLSKQVQTLREELQNTKEAMMKAVTGSIRREFGQNLEIIKNIGQQRSFFKKDQLCPVKDCTRKYSSKIALRAHIRKNHAPKAPFTQAEKA